MKTEDQKRKVFNKLAEKNLKLWILFINSRENRENNANSGK